MPERAVPLRRVALWAVGCGVAVMALALAGGALPRLEGARPAITGTPVPPGMRNEVAIPLAPGERVCMRDVVVDRGTGRVSLVAPPDGATARRLVVELRGERLHVARAVTLGPDEALAEVEIAPLRSDVTAMVCARNAGAAPLQLAGTADPRVLVVREATRDGRRLADPAAFVLTFRAPHATTPVERLSQTVARAAALSAVGPWAYWFLLALVLAVPAVVLAALALALRDDAAREEGAAR